MKKQKRNKHSLETDGKKNGVVQSKKTEAAAIRNENTKGSNQENRNTAVTKSENEGNNTPKTDSVYGVILAGGTGSRFWPLSRAALPKQFLDLPDCDFRSHQSLLTRTARRLSSCLTAEHLVVATNKAYGSLVRAALPELTEDHLVLEETNRDTAFAVAFALERVLTLAETTGEREIDKTLVIFAPCDHHIENTAAFQQDLQTALCLAATGKLVTLGIVPTAPRTEYGYLLAGRKERECGGGHWRKGKKFWEKPGAKRAVRLLKEKNLYWNSGILVGQLGLFARLLAAALERDASDQPSLSELSRAEQLRQIQKRLAEAKVPRSFDRLVMEQLPPDSFAVVPASFDWDDLGTFSSLEKYWRQEGGNHICGCSSVSLDSEGNVVYREGGLVALVDVRDLLVAEADGVLLIMPKKESHRLKKLVRVLEKQDLREYL